LDEALKDLEMGEGNKFLSLRGSMLDAEGRVRTDIFKPRGDIHLNASGTTIASLRIRKMLEIMMPVLNQVPFPVPGSASVPVQTPQAPVQTPSAKVQRPRVQAPVSDPAPVAVNTPPVVGTPLVAVVNAPAVVVQDQVETPMETDEDELLAKLFFKKYGRALPEKEKEKDAVDQINFVIDLTEDTEEMQDNAIPLLIQNPVVKTEPAEIISDVANVADVTDVVKQRRASRRLEIIELARARKAITAFGKSLRKTDVIQEKEAPLAAGTSAITDTDTNMSEDVPVSIEEAERAMAESEAEIAATQKVIDEFDD
jgi:hypothetical protein